jgi:hypothetical protein
LLLSQPDRHYVVYYSFFDTAVNELLIKSGVLDIRAESQSEDTAVEPAGDISTGIKAYSPARMAVPGIGQLRPA